MHGAGQRAEARWRLAPLMARKTLLLGVLALAMAAVFIRLGVWQLDRRQQRLAVNALVEERRNAPPVPPASLPADASRARYRRVLIRGKLDYAREFIYTGRTHNGSPGVNLLTPLRRAGHDTAILVNRGWVYSGSASEVDLDRWREGDSIAGTGYVLMFTRPDGRGASVGGDPRKVRQLDREYIEARLPYPVAPYIVMLTGIDSSRVAPGAASLARLAVPALDEGPHLSYAIQWFSFALIAIAGTAVLIRSERATRSALPGDDGRAAHVVRGQRED